MFSELFACLIFLITSLLVILYFHNIFNKRQQQQLLLWYFYHCVILCNDVIRVFSFIISDFLLSVQIKSRILTFWWRRDFFDSVGQKENLLELPLN